jgi:nitrate/TMAO reductase-like tetraheme cytochrome c subunit
MDMNMFKKLIVVYLVLIGLLLLISNVSASENSCIDCHKTLSPFIEVQKQFNQIRIQHLEKSVTCSLECHEDRVQQLATANYLQWSESTHALNGVTCDVCHGGNPAQPAKEQAHASIKKTTDTESPVYYTNVPETCGKCHSKELDNFENSKHFKKLEDLKLAPTCTTCHAPHTFEVLNSVEFRNFCGNCHSVYKKVAPYDVPLNAEYLLGKVNKLKFNIDTANQDIFWAEKEGTDVTQANKYVNEALDKMNKLAPMWHEFNMTHFEAEVDSANALALKAQKLVTPSPTPTQTAASQTPGFVGISGIVSLLSVLLIIRKKQGHK